RRRHTRSTRDWSSDVCSSDLPSALEMVLDDLNIPVAVYTGLIEGVRRNLPALHRYLRLRKRMLGVDRLHYFDLYAPLVASVNVEIGRASCRERGWETVVVV